MAGMQQRPHKRVIRVGMGMLIGMILIFGCNSPHQHAPLLSDTLTLTRTPILLTSEAQAEATATAFDKQLEGFEGRTKAGSATDEAAIPDETVQATDEAELTPAVDANKEVQLTKAPTIEAFLTKLARTPTGEGTPSPPPGCPGGCTTVPPWCEPPIKGSVSIDSGERIYSVPADESYAETSIDPDKGEYYFCTPEEAEAAGFRRAYR